MMTKVALTICLHSSSLPLQAAISEREITGLLHQLPLPSKSDAGVQSVPRRHSISPSLASSPTSHCMTLQIRTTHCPRKTRRHMELGRCRLPRGRNAHRYRWTSHTLSPRIQSRLASSRPSQTAKATHLVACVPGYLRATSSISALRHWTTTTCLPSLRRSPALDWSPILSTV